MQGSSARRSPTLLLAHIVWATRGRESMLPQAADPWLAAFLQHRARILGALLVACGNAADHVHLLVRYPATVCVAEVVHHLKGAASYAWNARQSEGPHLIWQAGYWAESVSPADAPAVKLYVERQRDHHQTPCAVEPWQEFQARDQRSPAEPGFR